MPFCIKCGTNVTDQDQFCGGCGERQDHATGTTSSTASTATADDSSSQSKRGTQDMLGSLDPRTAALLCYIPVIGWIGSVIVLSSNRFRHDAETRFHAFQGLYLFVVYLIVDYVLGPMLSFQSMDFHVEKILKLGLLAAWIFLLVKTSQGVLFKLPILGELADRSVSEQR